MNTDKELESQSTYVETEEEKQSRLNSIYSKQYEMFDAIEMTNTETGKKTWAITYGNNIVSEHRFKEEQEAIDYLCSKPYDIIITLSMGTALWIVQNEKGESDLKQNIQNIKN